MKGTYKIKDEFEVEDKKVLVLDKPRNIDDFDTSNIVADGKKYHYSLTHNREWIIVKTKNLLKGKEIAFV